MLNQKRELAYLFIFLFLISSCAIVFRSNEIKTDVQSESVESPIKVHMTDGRTVLFHQGATFSELHIVGRGHVYSLDMKYIQDIDTLDRKDIAAYEVFETGINKPATAFASTVVTGGAIAGTVIGAVFLSFALFGSCPTVYAANDSSMVLESELFSNSIAPIIEKRDVTDLYAMPDVTGLLELEIRNEALETHYINHLELLEVSHQSGSSVFPDTDGQIYAVDNFQSPISAFDSTGSNLLPVFSDSDDLVYSSTIDTSASKHDIKWDTIDLEFEAGDENGNALVLDLRNSLFATVLLYDYLIASQGVQSLDWMAKDLATVSGAVEMGDFNQSFMGLRVYQEIDGSYKPINRISNTGPIASRKIAVPLEKLSGDTVKVRLKFLSDSWRINQIEMVNVVEEPQVKFIAVKSVLDAVNQSSPDNLHRLSEPDDEYVITTPGNRFSVSFQTGNAEPGLKHTYLLAAQGYYTEWVREEWIQNGPETPFELSANLVVQAQHEWQRVKKDFEQKFFESKIPVR